MSVVLAFLDLSYFKDATVIKQLLECKIKEHSGASPKARSLAATKFNSFKGHVLSWCTSQLPL